MTRAACVMTHRSVHDTGRAFEPLLKAAREADVELRFDVEESAKHRLEGREGVALVEQSDRDVDLCIVLGGDGTILRALRRFANTDVPVFAMNFGEVGFLATVDPDGMELQFRRAFAHEFEVLRLPGVVLSGVAGEKTAINDISIHRKVGERVAQLAYAIEDAELG
jgi:NAD+ kinase